MHIISTDKTVRNDTIQDLKEFNNESLTTKAKKGAQLFFMMPAIKIAFVLMGVDIVELHREIESLKNKFGSYDDKWLEESKTRFLQQIDDEKRANLLMSRKKKHRKALNKLLILVIINYLNQNSMVSFLKEINYKI